MNSLEVKTPIANRHVEDALALSSVQICRPSLHPFRHTSDFKPVLPATTQSNSNLSGTRYDDEEPQPPDKSDRLSSKLIGSGRSPSLVSLPHPPCLTARQASLLYLLEDLSGFVAAQSAIEGQIRALQQLAAKGSPVSLPPFSIFSRVHP